MSLAIPGFGRSEFLGRLDRLRAVMRERGAGVMLIDDIEILAYYTGYERSISFYRACLVPLEGDPVMVLRALDTAPFLEVAWFTDCIGYPDAAEGMATVAAVMRDRGLDRAALGVDMGSHGMTVSGYLRLQALLPDTKIVDMTSVPWEMRLIKSSLEIEHIAAAAGIADQTAREIVAMAKPGMSARQITAFAAKRYVELGALPGHVGPVTYGKDWGFLHGHMHDTPMVDGDILHLELVPRFRGYSARLMRSVVMGRPSPGQKRAAQALIDLQDRQIAAMVPGATAREVDAILRRGLLDGGLRDTYDNITGYTLGYYSQQPVRSSDFTRVFSPVANWTLEAGMVFHMYTSAQGMAFSETVLVDREGPRRLTRLERTLYNSDPTG